MRKLSVLLAVAVVASVLFLLPGIALANFAIHGGYAEDTDSCAGCHRAHTATSSATWTNDDGDERSALLISTATEVFEFCFTCHGRDAAGANTNVWDGQLEDATGTLGDFMGQLNSGAFGDDVVGINKHTYAGGSWVAWGGGLHGGSGDPLDPDGYQLPSRGGADVVMTCGSCHDVHGSSNYRLLKDVVNNVTVGGYLNDDPVNPTPDPFVISNEPNYPEEGWRLADAGAAQMALYEPNYTTPMYAKAPGDDPAKGISAWCAACHTQYVNEMSVYDANDSFDFNQWGYTERYRHPVNVPLSNYKNAARPLNIDLLSLRGDLPVAASFGAPVNTWAEDNWVDCLTCHRAHGSDAEMVGFATDQDEGWITSWDTEGPQIQYPGTKNAFLRLDNRGVCQQCHYK